MTVNGETVLSHALRSLVDIRPTQLIVTAPEDQLAEVQAIADTFVWPRTEVRVVVGGVTRQDSVGLALKHVSAPNVLVHDAARCFTPSGLFRRVLAEVERSQSGVIPVNPVSDTIKQVRDGVVLQTLPRAELAAVQTPQGFPTALLRAAHQTADRDFTDDAALAEASGQVIRVVAGEPDARKITTPADLSSRAERRVGTGMDSHRFSDSGALVLGCVDWPGFPSLLGHSDGDAAAHALVDALLSAAGLGDLGAQFGVDRPEYAGASGERFLLEAARMLSDRGWKIENGSLQIMADLPKIAPRRLELEERLSAILEAPISVAATTTDGLGFLSDARGVGAVATALIRRQS